jgi:ADP-ribose pyrophosphatase YjhB (NUDIX family)
MKNLSEALDLFEKGYLEYRPGLTVDCAIFGYHSGELKILLIKNKLVTKWCLPGGWVKKSETLEDAAARVTKNRTGIENLFLKQFKTFSKPGRGFSADILNQKDFAKFLEIVGKSGGWFLDETVSAGLYAITDIVKSSPTPDYFSDECKWFPINDLPDLGFDHNEMVAEALLKMRIDLYHFPIGKSLLQPKFTLKEIKTLYEVLSGKTLSATNFPIKLMSLGLLVKLDEKKSIGAHRSPTYYKFSEDEYEKALNDGLVLV